MAHRKKATWYSNLYNFVCRIFKNLLRIILWLPKQLWRFMRWFLKKSALALVLVLVVAGVGCIIWGVHYQMNFNKYQKAQTIMNPEQTPVSTEPMVTPELTAIPVFNTELIATPTPVPTSVPTPTPTLVPTPEPTPIPTQVPYTVAFSTGDYVLNSTQSSMGVIISRTATLRSKASTSSSKIGTLNNNQLVEVLAEEGDWFYVRTTGGSEGYLRKCFVQRNNNDWVIFQETLTPVYSAPYYTAPTEEGALVGERTAGEAYIILGYVQNSFGNWMKIKYHLGVGFIRLDNNLSFCTIGQIRQWYDEAETIQLICDTKAYTMPGRNEYTSFNEGEELIVVDGGRVENGYVKVAYRFDENGEIDGILFIPEEFISRG